MNTRRFIYVLLAVSVAVSLHAQQPLTRGKNYILRVPTAAMKLEGVSAWSGTPTYSAGVESSPSGVSINGSSVWLARGYPSNKPITLRKTRSDRSTGQYEIELAGEAAGDPVVKLRFANEAAAASLAPQVLIDAADQGGISAWRESALAELAKATFTGALAQLPADRQRALLEALHNSGTGQATAETYKDKTYLAVDLGTGDYVYNTLQMNQTARVARRMADVLGAVKSLHKAIGGCPDGVHGIKISFQADYKNFLRESERGADSVQAYFPCDLIAKFEEADITSQALVNGSVILVGGDRVDVSLTQ